MRQKDVALIIIIAFISAVVSLFASRLLFTSSKNKQQQAPVVPMISDNFPAPDSRYFNSKSIDPTQLIQIQNNNNPNQFNGSGQ